MKVARVTVRATTQGLMTGRDFGLGVESSFRPAGGVAAGAAPGGSKTAWFATVDRPFPLPQQADVRDDVTGLYMTLVLYPESDVLREREGSGISF
jgi:hypothetical protein